MGIDLKKGSEYEDRTENKRGVRRMGVVARCLCQLGRFDYHSRETFTGHLVLNSKSLTFRIDLSQHMMR